MGISLQKGGNISLNKYSPGISKVLVGLGWDERSTDGAEFDLDASVFLLSNTGKVRNDNDFIFYNQLTSACGSVEHTGDERTGGSDGDDEAIKVDLVQVSQEIQKIVVTVTMHNAEKLNQNFGQVSNAFIRIVNEDTGAEVCRYDLTEDYSIETAMIFGELYRKDGDWKFRAVGQGYEGGLAAMCRQFGVNVG